MTSELFLPWLFSHEGQSLLSSLLAETTVSLTEDSELCVCVCGAGGGGLFTVCVCFSLWLQWIITVVLISEYISVESTCYNKHGFSAVCWLAAVESHAMGGGGQQQRDHTGGESCEWKKESTRGRKKHKVTLVVKEVDLSCFFSFSFSWQSEGWSTAGRSREGLECVCAWDKTKCLFTNSCHILLSYSNLIRELICI